MKKNRLLIAVVLVLAAFFAFACTPAGDPPVVEPTKYTVDFNSNGGSAVEKQKVESGKKATKPTDPTKENHAFLGWYLSESFVGDVFDFNTAITGDITLNARWVEVFTVTFNTNGGSAVEAQKVENGKKATKPTDPTKADHIFDGWYISATFEGSEYDFNTAVTASITINAKWVEVFTVTFNTNGGSAVEAQKVENGKKATKPTDPAKADHIFDGWYISATFEGSEYDFNTAITASITINVKWIDKVALVSADIESLPAAAAITLEDKADVEAAREAFDELTSAGQARVSNSLFDKLVAVEEKIQQLLSEKRVRELNEAVAELTFVAAYDESVVLSEEEIEAILSAFDLFKALTAEEKALITDADSLIVSAAFCDFIPVYVFMTTYDPYADCDYDFEVEEEFLAFLAEVNAVIDEVISTYNYTVDKYLNYSELLDEFYENAYYLENEYLSVTQGLSAEIIKLYPHTKNIPTQEEFSNLDPESAEFLAVKESVYAVWMELTFGLDSPLDMSRTKQLALYWLSDMGVGYSFEILASYYVVPFIISDITELGAEDAFEAISSGMSLLMSDRYYEFINGENGLPSAEETYQLYLALEGETKEYFDTILSIYTNTFLAGYANLDLYDNEGFLALFAKIEEFENARGQDAIDIAAEIDQLFEALSQERKQIVLDSSSWGNYQHNKEYAIIRETFQSFDELIKHVVELEDFADYVAYFDTFKADITEFYNSLSSDMQLNFENRMESSIYHYEESIRYNLERFFHHSDFDWNADTEQWYSFADVVLFVEMLPMIECAVEYFPDEMQGAIESANYLVDEGLVDVYKRIYSLDYTYESLDAAKELLDDFSNLDSELLALYANDFLDIMLVEGLVYYYTEYATEDQDILEVNALVLALDLDITLQDIDQLEAALNEIRDKCLGLSDGFYSLPIYIAFLYNNASLLVSELRGIESYYYQIDKLPTTIDSYDYDLFRDVYYYYSTLQTEFAKKYITNLDKVNSLLAQMVAFMENEIEQLDANHSSLSLEDAIVDYNAVLNMVAPYLGRGMLSNEQLLIKISDNLNGRLAEQLLLEIEALGSDFTLDEAEALLLKYNYELGRNAFWRVSHEDVVQQFSYRVVVLVLDITQPVVELGSSADLEDYVRAYELAALSVGYSLGYALPYDHYELGNQLQNDYYALRDLAYEMIYDPIQNKFYEFEGKVEAFTLEEMEAAIKAFDELYVEYVEFWDSLTVEQKNIFENCSPENFKKYIGLACENSIYNVLVSFGFSNRFYSIEDAIRFLDALPTLELAKEYCAVDFYGMDVEALFLLDNGYIALYQDIKDFECIPENIAEAEDILARHAQLDPTYILYYGYELDVSLIEEFVDIHNNPITDTDILNLIALIEGLNLDVTFDKIDDALAEFAAVETKRLDIINNGKSIPQYVDNMYWGAYSAVSRLKTAKYVADFIDNLSDEPFENYDKDMFTFLYNTYSYGEIYEITTLVPNFDKLEEKIEQGKIYLKDILNDFCATTKTMTPQEISFAYANMPVDQGLFYYWELDTSELDEIIEYVTLQCELFYEEQIALLDVGFTAQDYYAILSEYDSVFMANILLQQDDSKRSFYDYAINLVIADAETILDKGTSATLDEVAEMLNYVSLMYVAAMSVFETSDLREQCHQTLMDLLDLGFQIESGTNPEPEEPKEPEQALRFIDSSSFFYA